MDVILKTPLSSKSEALSRPHDHKQGDSVFYQPLGSEGLNLLNLLNLKTGMVHLRILVVYSVFNVLFVYLLLIDVFFNHVSLISSLFVCVFLL